eukprot:GFYU01017549.1.p1 GENE.GFYU01017549.1~~GFYU01017549.1.p1  ORF type:complete len:298 (-),score=45.49 GFYU01017549.1:586-1479(-)
MAKPPTSPARAAKPPAPVMQLSPAGTTTSLHIPSTSFKFPSRICPTMGMISWFVTISTCVTLNRLYDHDIGGIPWPYISDTGKYSPERAVFSFGCTITCIYMLTVVALNYGKVKRDIEIRHPTSEFGTRGTKRNMVSFVAGIVGCPFLGLLASFDTADTPGLHLICVLVFFPLMLTWMYFNTSVYIVLVQYERATYGRAHRALVISKNLKITLSVLMTIFVMLYLPIGMCLVNDWYNYGADWKIHTFRAVNQHLAVACLVFYFGTHFFDFGKLNMEIVQGEKIVRVKAANTGGKKMR